MPMPTKRHDDVEEEILKAISEGVPLAVICRSDPVRYPTPMTWGNWCNADETLAIAYARAREVGFDAIATECLSIADETAYDTKKVGEDEREVADTEWISRSKLRVETRLKLLAKWDPKRYGDALLHKHADADGEKIRLGEVEQLTRIASLASKLQERLGDTDNSE